MSEVIENKICDGADRLKAVLSSGMTSLQSMVAQARIVGCRSK